MTFASGEQVSGAAGDHPAPGIEAGATGAVLASSKPVSKAKIAIGVAAVLALVLLYWALSQSGTMPTLSDEAGLQAKIEDLGIWGPLAYEHRLRALLYDRGDALLYPAPNRLVAETASDPEGDHRSCFGPNHDEHGSQRGP